MHPDLIKKGDPANDYELLQRVGSGTYGEVFKAKHTRNGDFAAVKVVKLEAGDNFLLIQQEILMIRECVHPNIISYHGSYLRRDRLWIVMEYCGGGSLQDIYHMTGPLSELQIAFICRETLKGLSYLHSKNMIHRDIKGANILLTNAGHIKLADFGIAARITATIGKRKSFIGTPYWMAPEVACVERRGGYGSECDVWAIGITAIELAELQPPLFDHHPMQVLTLMTKSSYKPPTLRDKFRWSPFFHDFVKQCLTRNPKKRPTPDKLLATHHFVLGALSSRMTRDLLDKVNNPGGVSSSLSQRYSVQVDDEDDETNGILLSRITSKGKIDRFRETEVIKADEGVNPILSRLWNNSSSKSASDMCQRCYCEENTLLAKVQAPLPDVVQALSLLEDNNGVLFENHDETLRLSNADSERVNNSDFSIPMRPPRRKRIFKRSSSLESASVHSSNVVKRDQDFRNLPSRPVTCFGLPPTPKVTMGACFSLIFSDCPLHINRCCNWTNPHDNRHYLIVGAEEGIFTLNMDELHDATMVLIQKRRCLWLHIQKNILMAVQGKNPHLYRHDLLALLQKNLTQRIPLPMNKISEKLIPKMFAITTRLPETRTIMQCNVARSALDGNIYLCCGMPNTIILYQWYEPLKKFLVLKTVEISIPFFPLRPFQLIYSAGAESDFPKVCLAVHKYTSAICQYHLEMLNFNADSDQCRPIEKMYSETTALDVVALKQIDKDSLLLCHNNQCVVVDQQGVVKSSRLFLACFSFDFHVEHLVPLSDSILAFHSYGVQGRAFMNGEITQDINDPNNIYQVIGSDRLVVLKRRRVSSNSNTCDLCILAGHESTFATT